jgi:hypothetical protein
VAEDHHELQLEEDEELEQQEEEQERIDEHHQEAEEEYDESQGDTFAGIDHHERAEDSSARFDPDELDRQYTVAKNATAKAKECLRNFVGDLSVLDRRSGELSRLDDADAVEEISLLAGDHLLTTSTCIKELPRLHEDLKRGLRQDDMSPTAVKSLHTAMQTALTHAETTISQLQEQVTSVESELRILDQEKQAAAKAIDAETMSTETLRAGIAHVVDTRERLATRQAELAAIKGELSTASAQHQDIQIRANQIRAWMKSVEVCRDEQESEMLEQVERAARVIGDLLHQLFFVLCERIRRQLYLLGSSWSQKVSPERQQKQEEIEERVQGYKANMTALKNILAFLPAAEQDRIAKVRGMDDLLVV